MLIESNDTTPSALVNLTYLTEEDRRQILKDIVSPATYQIGETQREMIMVKDLSMAILINKYIGESVLVAEDIYSVAAFVPDMVETLYVILPSYSTDDTFENFETFGNEASNRGVTVQILQLDDDKFSLSKFISNPDYLFEFFNSVKDGEKGRGSRWDV